MELGALLVDSITGISFFFMKHGSVVMTVSVHGHVKGGLKPNVFVMSAREASLFEMLVLSTGAHLMFLALKSL